jgi:hypothetical protein
LRANEHGALGDGRVVLKNTSVHRDTATVVDNASSGITFKAAVGKRSGGAISDLHSSGNTSSDIIGKDTSLKGGTSRGLTDSHGASLRISKGETDESDT